MDSPTVLQVNKFYYPQIGGIEAAVRALAEGMTGRGFDVRVLASRPFGWGETDEVADVPVQRTASLGEVLSVPIAPAFPLRYRQASSSVDIVHHHLPNPLGVGSHLLAPPNGAKVLITYHSDIVRQATALRVYRPFLDAFLRRSDRILVTSPNLLNHSEVLKPYSDKCQVVPLSIDTGEYGGYEGPAHDIPGQPGERILFVGRLNYYKGVEYLVDAMAQVEGTLLIAGDGNRRDSLEERTSEAGLNDRIHFLGRVPDEKLDYLYDAADIFVLPSVAASEAFGIVQLEAMAFGTPIVNTALPTGVPWVSQDGETGLTVPPRDTTALADAISRLLDDGQLRRELGENAAERVERMFDRQTMLDTMGGVYADLLAE